MGKRCKEGARVCGAEINSKGKKKSRDKFQHQCQSIMDQRSQEH